MVSSPSLRRRTVATALVVLGAGLPACGRDDPPARAAPAAAAHGIRFDDVTEACGVRSTRRSGGGDDLRNIAQAAGGGVAVLDADGDGWMDLFFTEGGTDPDLTPDAKTTSGRGALWRNRGDGTFEDVTDRAGLRELGAYPFGATAADWDGDGDTDLYVCTYRRDRLFRNEGGLRFVDATEAAGVVEDAFSVHAVFLDYDRDGALDLYVVRYLAFDPSYRVFYAPEGFPGPLSYKGVADLLWHNRGDGTFEIDLAIMGRPPQELETVSEPFAENPLVFVAAPDHPLAKAKSIAPKQLAGESFLLREPGSGTRAAMERFLAENGVLPQRAVEMTSNETIKQAVMAGMGISFISERTIALELATGHIVRLSVAGTPLQRHWFVVHRAEKRLLPVAEAFRQFLLRESGGPIEPARAAASASSGSSRASRKTAAGRRPR